MKTQAPAADAPHRAIVFVVDDDEDLLESVQELLEQQGHLVLLARNGEEALSRMKGISGPTMALVDLMMPDMNGWELIAAMKAHENLAQIPIVTCSAHVFEPLEHARAHLTKPINSATLIAAVRAALGAPE